MTNKPLTKTGTHFAVIYTVSRQFRIFIEQLLSPDRGIREVQKARIAAIYLVRETCPHYTTEEIGWLFSRDYTSVLSAINSAKDRLETDRNFKKQLNECKKQLSLITF